MRVVLHQVVYNQSGLYQDGLSSGWSLIRMVSNEDGPYQGFHRTEALLFFLLFFKSQNSLSALQSMFKRFRPIALRKTAVTKRRPYKKQTNQTNKKWGKKWGDDEGSNEEVC